MEYVSLFDARFFKEGVEAFEVLFRLKVFRAVPDVVGRILLGSFIALDFYDENGFSKVYKEVGIERIGLGMFALFPRIRKVVKSAILRFEEGLDMFFILRIREFKKELFLRFAPRHRDIERGFEVIGIGYFAITLPSAYIEDVFNRFDILLL